MKHISTQLNKAFDHRIRLGLMSVLMVNDWVDFNTLKELLDATDGNLASHIKALEAENYIEVKKQFIGRRPNTSYAATELGKKAFNDHLDALEQLLKQRD
ncbi:MAG: transcriptional regulator [Saprospiraceae bacterium]|nr:transcriptional regulator [Saprospiraceae bacterium]NUQ25131.1 transcriptional regulator [Saprospiraceae bacterium]